MKSSECVGYQSKEVCETCDLPNKSCAYRDWAEEVAPELAKAIEADIMNLFAQCKANNEPIPNSATLNLTKGTWEY